MVDACIPVRCTPPRIWRCAATPTSGSEDWCPTVPVRDPLRRPVRSSAGCRSESPYTVLGSTRSQRAFDLVFYALFAALVAALAGDRHRREADQPRPVLYGQERVGLDGRQFGCSSSAHARQCEAAGRSSRRTANPRVNRRRIVVRRIRSTSCRLWTCFRRHEHWADPPRSGRVFHRINSARRSQRYQIRHMVKSGLDRVGTDTRAARQHQHQKRSSTTSIHRHGRALDLKIPRSPRGLRLLSRKAY